MKRKIIKKLNNISGETLVETLAAILVISLTFAFLCNSILSAGKINTMVKNEHPEMDYTSCSKTGSYQIVVSSTPGGSNDATRHRSGTTVNVYEDSTGNYIFYNN